MIIYLFILAAIATRFVPHMPNLVPITAIAIFAGAYLPMRQAIALPLVIRFISDIFLGFFSWPLMIAVYASHMVGILFGLWIKKSPSNKWIKIVASSLGSSAVFFLATNFAFLYKQYPHKLGGIMQAYTNGLPFLRGTVLGDLGYTLALFGGVALIEYIVLKRAAARLAEQS